ncbi:succinylglutamate desuccinylase/aspartoacylase family protein [Deinococcus peraridilitoris]|uniref:Putative deacylase n=1 Tax=Deinococcus peraridilitoris (strain DSM 19664 / LMG 22246 / CIP 109416 / KR-200) TaxID=937777 RepID=L0A743_DEIPD|nr:succinylglutamate desuccinylase/aspartoacylase family protein [Deinococcus peraridilitoris]AFZ69678.1 putative deacylase [Deinococcus peraridilitoris DSM 19664]
MTSLPALLEATKPGTTHHGFLTAPVNPATQISVHVIRGPHPGPTLLITAGVHGAEYASIEAAYQMARTDPLNLTGTLVVLPIVNPTAFFERSIYINPIDGKNLNRMFPGRAQGTYAERLAYWLHEHYLTRTDALLDLHGGDLVEALEPFSVYTRDHQPSRDLGRAFGLPHLLPSSSAGVSISIATSHNIPAIIAEAGGQGRWTTQDVRRLTDGCFRVMTSLGMITGAAEALPITEHHEFAWLHAPRAGLWRPQVTVGEHVQAGQHLGTLSSLLDSEQQTFMAPNAGVVLFLVSSLAMNEGDPLIGIGAGTHDDHG